MDILSMVEESVGGGVVENNSEVAAGRMLDTLATYGGWIVLVKDVRGMVKLVSQKQVSPMDVIIVTAKDAVAAGYVAGEEARMWAEYRGRKAPKKPEGAFVENARRELILADSELPTVRMSAVVREGDRCNIELRGDRYVLVPEEEPQEAADEAARTARINKRKDALMKLGKNAVKRGDDDKIVDALRFMWKHADMFTDTSAREFVENEVSRNRRLYASDFRCDEEAAEFRDHGPDELREHCEAFEELSETLRTRAKVLSAQRRKALKRAEFGGLAAKRYERRALELAFEIDALYKASRRSFGLAGRLEESESVKRHGGFEDQNFMYGMQIGDHLDKGWSDMHDSRDVQGFLDFPHEIV